MKTSFLTLALLVLSAPLSYSAVDYDRVGVFPFYIDQAATRSGNDVVAQGPFIQLHPRHPDVVVIRSNKKQSVTVPAPLYDFLVNQSTSAFVARQGSGDGFGTAFLIGRNIVLTNDHVVQTGSSCGRFAVEVRTLPAPARDMYDEKDFPITLDCDRVLFCDVENDLCAVQIEPLRNHQELGDVISPWPIRLNAPFGNTSSTFLIGNSYNQGLQAMSGRGNEVRTMTFHRTRQLQGGPVEDLGQFTVPVFLHYAPAFEGSSGGPLFNRDGEILGVNAARSKELYGENIPNVGVPSSVVVRLLRQHLTPSELSTITIREVLP